MIELPEALRLAQQMREVFVGKRITSACADASPHGFAFYYGDPAAYPDMLVGKRVTGAQAYGGRVELLCEDMRVVLNDGVNARYYPPEAAKPEKHQLYLGFDDGGALVCTVQMYAALMACPIGTDLGFYDSVAKEKPSPLSDTFDHAFFGGLVAAAKPSTSAKALLATEQRIPGLGNGVLQDILLNARVHPKRKISAMSIDELDGLYDNMKSTLARMAALGGRDTEKDLFGEPGGYHTLLSAKTANGPCPFCGGAITRMAYLGGNVYFCGTCQPL